MAAVEAVEIGMVHLRHQKWRERAEAALRKDLDRLRREIRDLEVEPALDTARGPNPSMRTHPPVPAERGNRRCLMCTVRSRAAIGSVEFN
jgi:hypothetical protein